LSELGGFLLSPDQAPAGTKRISNLLRCMKWTFEIIARFLWQKADTKRQALLEQEESPYVVWDDSVNEKPESQKAEGLGPARSSKAKRLSRIKPGYYISSLSLPTDGSPAHARPADGKVSSRSLHLRR
jgi:hypothetical protein